MASYVEFKILGELGDIIIRFYIDLSAKRASKAVLIRKGGGVINTGTTLASWYNSGKKNIQIRVGKELAGTRWYEDINFGGEKDVGLQRVMIEKCQIEVIDRVVLSWRTNRGEVRVTTIEAGTKMYLGLSILDLDDKPYIGNLLYLNNQSLVDVRAVLNNNFRFRVVSEPVSI